MPEHTDKPTITIVVPVDKEQLKKVVEALTGEDEPQPGGSGPVQPKPVQNY